MPDVVPDYSSQLLPYLQSYQDPSTPNYADHMTRVFGLDQAPNYSDDQQAAAAKIGQGEALVHSLAQGATANWSPVLAGDLDVASRYELVNNLLQAKAMGMLDANGEQALQQLTTQLKDPSKLYAGRARSGDGCIEARAGTVAEHIKCRRAWRRVRDADPAWQGKGGR